MWVVSLVPSLMAIGYPLSAIGYPLSAIGYRLSALAAGIPDWLQAPSDSGQSG
jgi:hypothetical protein